MIEMPRSDRGRAQFLARHVKDEFLYIPEYSTGGKSSKGWMWYDKKTGTWLRDVDGSRIIGRVGDLMEWQAGLAFEENDRNAEDYWLNNQSNGRINSAVQLARPLLLGSPDDFDADQDLLCCKNCVVNLRTGEALDHDPKYRMTMLAGADYDPLAECPTWDEYFAHTVPDEETRLFLQRSMGYSLTPHDIEQAFFVLVGTQGTGKSTFVDTISQAMGSYAMSCAPATLAANKSGVRSDLAVLKGARLVSTQELQHNDVLNLSLVKTMTGGEKLTASLKFENEESFYPTWKTWVSYNIHPTIPDDSTGLWRRIKVVEFNQFHEKEDSQFRFKLLAELEGVLAWAIRGAQAWFAHGIGEPAKVKASTKRMREGKDSIYAFVNDRCHRVKGNVLRTAELYDVYVEHCNLMLHAKPAAMAVFSTELNNMREVEQFRSNKYSCIRGLALLKVAPSVHSIDASDEAPEGVKDVSDLYVGYTE